MSSPNTGHADLLARVALRDRRAFSALYDATAPQVMGLLMGMLRRRDIAEDVLQDTYVKVWHRAADYHPQRGQVNTWIASIARYAAIDALRAEKVRQPDATDVDALADDGAVTEGLAESVSEEDRLRHCINTLSGDQRQTISLAFFRGFTHEELAAEMAIPLGTIKAWVRRGLRKLRECLES